MTLRCIHRHTQNSHPKCFAEGRILQREPRTDLWTEDEDETLLTLRNGKATYHDIGLAMNRSADSVRKRYRRLEKTEFEREARVLVLDIETSLMVFSHFRTGKTYLGADQILQDKCIISWAAKWLNEDKVFSGGLTPKEALAGDDSRILEPIWKLLDECDVAIGHNIQNFDNKILNTRFMINGMGLPEPYKFVDTLKLARKVFSFSSNKLDYICKVLGLDVKMEHTGYDLWLDCLKGDKEALDMMLAYNEQDILITEQLYHKLKEGLHGGLKPLRKYGYKK